MLNNQRKPTPMMGTLEGGLYANNPDQMGLFKAIEAFRQVDSNIYNLLKNSNIPAGKHSAVASLFHRGLTELKERGKDVKEIMNDTDRWHELPNPLILAITYVIAASAEMGLAAMQSVMAMTNTIIVPPPWRGDDDKKVKDTPPPTPIAQNGGVA